MLEYLTYSLIERLVQDAVRCTTNSYHDTQLEMELKTILH